MVVDVAAMAGATSAGIYWVSRLYFCSLLISNTKAIKPVVTVGASEKWKNGPDPYSSVASASIPYVNNHSPFQREPL
jgi:hypothetical protein